MTLDEVLTLQNQGAQIVDVRNPVDVAEEYLEGSITIGLNGKFATGLKNVMD